MRNQDEFTDYDFEGSGINSLLDVLAYNTHYLAMNMNMVSNESFLDTASVKFFCSFSCKDIRVYSKLLQETPIANINVELNNFGGLSSATIPLGTVFTTTIDDVNYQFVTTSEHTTQVSSGVLSVYRYSSL